MNPLFHELFQSQRYLNRQLNLALKKHGLHASQWSVLYCVYKHKKMALTDIWKYLNVEAPTTTRTVNRLIELGWLQTIESSDRRQKIVSLTKDALQKYDQIEADVIQFEVTSLESLSTTEKQQLLELIRKINIEE